MALGEEMREVSGFEILKHLQRVCKLVPILLYRRGNQ